MLLLKGRKFTSIWYEIYIIMGVRPLMSVFITESDICFSLFQAFLMSLVQVHVSRRSRGDE